MTLNCKTDSLDLLKFSSVSDLQNVPSPAIAGVLGSPTSVGVLSSNFPIAEKELFSPATAGVCLDSFFNCSEISLAVAGVHENSFEQISPVSSGVHCRKSGILCDFTESYLDYFIDNNTYFMNDDNLISTGLCSNMCSWFTQTAGSMNFEYPHIQFCTSDQNFGSKYEFNEMDSINFSQVHSAVFHSKKPNFVHCRIPVCSNFNINLWEQLLVDYHDNIIVEFLKYGWPLNYIKDKLPSPPVRRQNMDSPFSSFIDSYISKELKFGAIYGPFKRNPLFCPLIISPLFTVPKGNNDRRIIVDCSHGDKMSVNEGIPQDTFLNEPLKLSYPRHEEFISLILKHGRGCGMWKLDLSREFRQLVLDPHDLHLQGYEWRDDIYIDNRLIFGMRSSPQACQRTTNAVSYMILQHNISVVNYVDDFGGVSSLESAEHEYAFVLNLFHQLGLDVSRDKCFEPSHVLTFYRQRI